VSREPHKSGISLKQEGKREMPGMERGNQEKGVLAVEMNPVGCNSGKGPFRGGGEEKRPHATFLGLYKAEFDLGNFPSYRV